MKVYDKQKIIKEVETILTMYSDEKITLKYAKMLLEKATNNNDVVLSSTEIKKFLFNNETKKINRMIFESLRRIRADLEGVVFDYFPIYNLNFSFLENVVIDIDKVPNKDLSNVNFSGVKLRGSLDESILSGTNFDGYIGEIVLNPQKVQNRIIEYCKLAGVKVCGSFNGTTIKGTKFNGVKGNVKINPQNLKDKTLIGINFADTELIGTFNERINQYNLPSFEGCGIYDCRFKGLKKQIVINLDELDDCFFSKLAVCDLTGVIVKGNANSNYLPMRCISEDGKPLFDTILDDLDGSYYENDKGQTVYIHLFESRVWNKDKNKWDFISKKDEPNLQIKVNYLKSKKNKILSLLKSKKN